MAEKYDNERCEAWRDEVDKLLIFVCKFFVKLGVEEATYILHRLVFSRQL